MIIFLIIFLLKWNVFFQWFFKKENIYESKVVKELKEVNKFYNSKISINFQPSFTYKKILSIANFILSQSVTILKNYLTRNIEKLRKYCKFIFRKERN